MRWHDELGPTMLKGAKGRLLVSHITEARCSRNIRCDHSVCPLLLYLFITNEMCVDHACVVADDVDLVSKLDAEAQGQVVVDCLATTVGNAASDREEAQSRGCDDQGCFLTFLVEARHQLICEDLG